MKTVHDIDWTTIDFVDFGAGIGGSLASAQKRIGGVGVGIEQRASKVERAQDAGLNVVEGDIFDLPTEVSVRYVTIDNVLEHLPTMQHVEAALVSACNIAREFVYIRHPSFEDEAYLGALGLKQYWTDWKDHPSHILIADYAKMCQRLPISGWLLHPVRAAVDSYDVTILPRDTPSDQHDYDETIHGAKTYVDFDRTVYYAWDLVLLLRPEAPVRLEYLTDPEFSDRRPRVVRDAPS